MGSALAAGEKALIGRYAIFGEIASGGMATVHYGRLVGPVGFSRTVAIKRMHPHYAKDPEFVAMFLDEARLAARIQHTNVVSTLDIVATDDDLFLVMEYVQGETLSRLIRTVRERGERIPQPVALSIVTQALHGLHAAHEAKDERGVPLGVVHRDVSPQNVLVGVDGVARVLDFGVAKAAVRLQTTREGQLKGKLAYMAPEQLGGHVDRVTDLYSAGVVLWEALTSRRLYEANNEGELLRKILRGRPDKPSAHAEGLPTVLDDIALRALQIDPAERFQTAREMAVAIERSVPVAMPSEVGEWVEKVAHERLSAHAEHIAEIESSAHAKTTTFAHESGSRVRSPDESTSTQVVRGAAPSPATSQPPKAPGTSSKHEPSSRRRILVIDDSEVMLTRIRRALEAQGYDVVTTTRAVGNARHIPSCDLAIIDYHMPGIDGGTVIQSLRAAGNAGSHRCLFYLYTSDAAIAKSSRELGFDGVFTDKGNEDALVRQLRALFRMQQMRAMQRKKPAV
ncbi:MAG: protein kinase domain-containing protein [Polyangiaceae bacterium]